MSKICPNCGDSLPDEACFCGNCGHEFNVPSSSDKGTLFNGKIFIVMILCIVVIGSVLIFTHDFEGNQDGNSLAITITDVEGDSYDMDGRTSYSLMVGALFSNVPSNREGYIVKTTYYDSNHERIAQETEALSGIYFEDEEGYEYPYYFGSVESYQKLDPETVEVEIIKDKNTICNDTFDVVKSKIAYLN